MRIEELIIDGFKSYSKRTVISGWDPSFNCITGLNGSGKSNILDSICFVLGITTMSTVRAQSLQDLIYKRGQAGVTKASVTIIFDNSDRTSSPPGYESCPRISVTRQVMATGSKFLINGHNAKQQEVQQMFQSVQLNVNNPNFLIMQGQITKVLNMRPSDIVSLLEEAAGTRMYEDRREKALKTIEKKDVKMQETVKLLDEDVTPMLDKLRTEKKDYLEYQRSLSELERAERIVAAYDFVKQENDIAKTQNELEVLTTKVETLEKESTALENSVTRKEEQLVEVKRLKSQNEAYKTLTKLDADLKIAAENAERLKTSMEVKSEARSDEMSQLENKLRELEAKEKELTQKELSVANVKDHFEELEVNLKSFRAELRQEQTLLSSLETGLSTGDNNESGYAGEMKRIRDIIAQARFAIKNAELKKERLADQTSPESFEQAKIELQNTRSRIVQLNEEISKLESSTDSVMDDVDELNMELTQLREEIGNVDQELDNIRRSDPNIELNATRFSENQVKGLVGHLFSVSPDQAKRVGALEVCAGGRLYNIVVDSDTTGAQLLASGQQRRVTVLPLNKISPYILPPAKVIGAKRLAPGKVELALEFVHYDDEVSKAMQYVFGSTLICDDAATAKTVTFDRNVSATSITLDGDMYDPRGTLSGGSRAQNKGILVTFQKYNDLRRRREDLKAEYNLLNERVEEADKQAESMRNLRNRISLLKHERDLAEEQYQSGSAASLLSDFQTSNSELKSLEAEIAAQQESIEKQKARLSEVEKEAKEFNSDKSKKLKQIRMKVAHLSKQEHELVREIERGRDQYLQNEAVLNSLKEDVTNSKENLTACQKGIDELDEELRQLDIEHQGVQQILRKLEHQINIENSKIRSLDSELSNAQAAVESEKQLLSELKLEIRNTKQDRDKLKDLLVTQTENLEELKKPYDWLEKDRDLLGVAGTPYDFNSINITQCRQVVKTEAARQTLLQRKVNARVVEMLDSVESKESLLKEKITRIRHDKAKIEEGISKLNTYKQEALQRTWEKVSEDLGLIFGNLLPKSSAKLVPIDGNDISNGLSICVKLGNTWKEGLAELSGGQRSLVALSLILALLQFRPAPMYILDEVDAALDLDHTQNIGHIIKTRFQNSQFIVVSLKEGMFSNANRIFQTRFQDGTSTVSIMS